MPNNNIITGQHINPSKLKRAHELRRNMTPAERRLWQALRGKQLAGFKFRRQQIIDGFIVDFYCHAAGLVVEVDGPVHDEQEQREYDTERPHTLTARGLHVLRFRNQDVLTDIDTVLTRIRQTCHERTPNHARNSPPRVGEGPEEGSAVPRVGEGPGEGSAVPRVGESRRGVTIINFTHPLTDDHRRHLEALTDAHIERIIDVPCQIDPQEPLVPQVVDIVDSAGLTAAEWQSLPLLVNPPALNVIAVAVLAELHGRCGYFPTCIRLRPVADSVPRRFEVAELVDLQAVRDTARQQRS